MLPPVQFGSVQPFIYKVQATLDPSGTGTENLTLNGDSQFELHYFSASTSLQDATDPQPNDFEVLIKVNDQDLSNGRIPQRIISLPANFVVPQNRPIIFAPKSQFVFDFLNLIAGETDNVITFCMHGFKLML